MRFQIDPGIKQGHDETTEDIVVAEKPWHIPYEYAQRIGLRSSSCSVE